MRTVRIYQPGVYEVGHIVDLSPGASQHVHVVLRMHPGEALTLFCGDNREFSATIAAVHKKKVSVQIHAAHNVNRESPRKIHLAQAISKGDRMEWVIQKAVELGVTSITPLITAHCSVRLDADRMAKKQQQWQAIAVAACEQSGRNQLPILHPISTLPTYLKQCTAMTKLILHPNAHTSWRNLPSQGSEVAVFIGPEGGLSEQEIQWATAAQFQSLCLGPRILRTETAAIVALSLLQAIQGDLDKTIGVKIPDFA